MSKKSILGLIRRHLRQFHAYTPGEQPSARSKWIKLNTNENPFPPAPEVLEAVKNACDARFRLYPDPLASGLRKSLAKIHGVAPENVLVGNGSDDILAMCVRSFVEPSDSSIAKQFPHRATVQYFDPSYSLYPVIAGIHKARQLSQPLNPDFGIPSVTELRDSSQWDMKAALTFITTPNAPSGRGYATSQLEQLCRALKGVVVLDEAYAEFANENAMSLATRHPHVLVSRTFSKAYSLCFQRIGYVVGHPELIQALDKIRDSYNVNGLGQVAAISTLNHHEYYEMNFQVIMEERNKLSQALQALGFHVFSSQTNFILVEPIGLSAPEWFEKLREQKIMIRYFKHPRVDKFLRISVGSPSENLKLLTSIKKILKTTRTSH